MEQNLIIAALVLVILATSCGLFKQVRNDLNHNGVNRAVGFAATDSPVSGLPAPPGKNEAQPAGTPGNLTILNWAGFKGAVSYTFDDGNSSQIAHYAELQALAVRMTFYLTTGKSEASSSTWAQAVKDGHELGNHTVSHPHAATDKEIDGATAFIRKTFGVTPYTMAAPFGDNSYISFARSRFLLNRGVMNSTVGPNDSSDPFNLPCYVPAQDAPAGALNRQVDAARSGGRWQIILLHGFTGGTDGAYLPVAIGEFTSSVNYAKALGDMWLDSVVNIGAYWRAQKMLASATSKKSGKTTTWRWTLPDNFPPGKYLRVKVDGGTLKQGNKTLAWDSRGYYEVALDAGKLTLTP